MAALRATAPKMSGVAAPAASAPGTSAAVSCAGTGAPMHARAASVEHEVASDHDHQPNEEQSKPPSTGLPSRGGVALAASHGFSSHDAWLQHHERTAREAPPVASGECVIRQARTTRVTWREPPKLAAPRAAEAKSGGGWLKPAPVAPATTADQHAAERITVAGGGSGGGGAGGGAGGGVMLPTNASDMSRVNAPRVVTHHHRAAPLLARAQQALVDSKKRCATRAGRQAAVAHSHWGAQQQQHSQLHPHQPRPHRASERSSSSSPRTRRAALYVPPPPFARPAPVCASAGAFGASRASCPSDLSYLTRSRGAFAVHMMTSRMSPR